MIVSIPASAAVSIASGNGKNASENSTAPAGSTPSACSRAFRTASSTASTRETCPMPMPTVAVPFVSTIAFEVTRLVTSQPNASAVASTATGVSVTTSSPSGSRRYVSACWRRNPPVIGAIMCSGAASSAS